MKRIDPVVAAAAVVPVAAAAAPYVVPPGPVPFALTVLTLMWAPGYALQAAVLSRAPAGPVERLGIGVAASIALAALIATLAAIVRRADEALVVMGPLAVVAAASGAAALARPSPPRERAPRTRWARSPERALAMGVAAGIALAGVGVLASAPPAEDRSQLPFTEFMLTGPDGALGSHPREARQGEEVAIFVTAVSHEDERAAFDVVAWRDDVSFGSVSVTLEPGESWSRGFFVPTHEPGEFRLRFALLKEGVHYRHLETTFRVVP